ncbi:DUF6368 family protein [Catenulispora subtropica]|uniref:Uncharacterized protein n=1 Tax=Catenulispora subtropica TaxID=450798 RepID=A0ABP5DAB3_9ACTN
MMGSLIIIDLPGPVAAERLAELGTVLRGLGGRFEEARAGSYDVEVEPGRLGVADPEGGGPRLFTVSIAGPGFGDEGVFRAEHDGDPDLEPVIGFTPTHDVVIATRGRELSDRLLLVELGAVVQEVVGGLADIRVSSRLVDGVRGLPGVAAVVAVEDGSPRVFGNAEFLRAWAADPGFGDHAVGAGRPRSHF